MTTAYTPNITINSNPESISQKNINVLPEDQNVELNNCDISNKLNNFDYTAKVIDNDFVEIIKESKNIEQKEYLDIYASGEHLAHHVAYQNLEKNPIQKILEPNGEVRTYVCKPIKTKHEGLVAYTLRPLELKKGESADLKVIFRGTSSGASVLRDLEPNGAGSVSFAANRDLILKQLNDEVKEVNEITGKPVSVTIAGHSLGGADAQNCNASLTDAIAENFGFQYHQKNVKDGSSKSIPKDCREALNANTISKVQLYTLNSAGIPQTTVDRAKVTAEFLAEKRKKGQSNLTIKAYAQLTAGDGVALTGEGHTYSDVSNDVVEVDVLKAHIGSEGHHKLSLAQSAVIVAASSAISAPLAVVGGMVVASSAMWGLKDTAKSHTEFLHLKPAEEDSTYERFSNKTPEGQALVNRELSNKSVSLQMVQKASDFVIGTLQSVGEFASGLLWRYSAQKKAEPKASEIVVSTTPTVSVSQESNTSKSGSWCWWWR